jgi:hypothetical protein
MSAAPHPAPQKLSPAMQRVFDRADKNKNQALDGDAEIREMRLGMRAELADADRANLPGGNATYQQLVTLLGQAKPDKNGDGVISLTEFVEFAADLVQRRDALIAAARNQVAKDQAARNQAAKDQLEKQRQQQIQQVTQQRLQQQADQRRQQELTDRAKNEQLRQLAEQKRVAEKRAEDKLASEKRMAALAAQQKREADAQKRQQKEEAEKRQKAEELRRTKELEQKMKDAKKKK